jgi:hypothetical protein
MNILKSGILAVSVFCLIGGVASGTSISISGGAVLGQPGGNCCFNGDFTISGPGLFLFQATPDGPSQIGNCTLDSICDFSFSIGSSSIVCTSCNWDSGGSLGNIAVEFLDPTLTFKGSAFYSGATDTSVPMTVSGTIVGYQLIDCPGGGSCLGPKEFTLYVSGQGTGEFTTSPLGPGPIIGVRASFTGSATTTPEPISLVLTGTGLVGIFLSKKIRPRAPF